MSDVPGGANIKEDFHRGNRGTVIPEYRKSSSEQMNSGGMVLPGSHFWVQSRMLTGVLMSCRFTLKVQCRSLFEP